MYDIEQTLKSLSDKRAVLNHEKETTENLIKTMEQRRNSLIQENERLTLASKALQKLINETSIENLKRIEDICNLALSTVFSDQNIHFKIDTKVKRNTPVYELKLMQDGVEGSLNSFGGGPLSVCSVILKVMLNIMAKKYPFICLDETLSGLSVNYIPAMSRLLKDICREFDVTVLMVTHQEMFRENCDNVFEIHKISEELSHIEKI